MQAGTLIQPSSTPPPETIPPVQAPAPVATQPSEPTAPAQTSEATPPAANTPVEVQTPATDPKDEKDKSEEPKQSFFKKYKIPLIIVGSVLAVLIIAIVLLMVTRGKTPSDPTPGGDPSANVVEQPKLSEIGKQIDELMSADRQRPEDYPNELAFYAKLDDNGNYGAVKQINAQAVYLVGPSNTDGSCESVEIRKLVTDIKAVFDKNKYSFSEYKASTGGTKCGKVMVAQTDDELCSLKFNASQLKDGRYETLVTLGCYPPSDLAAGIKDLQEIKQLRIDTNIPISGELNAQYEVLRDSESGRFRIAILKVTDDYRYYYYKKIGGKWSAVPPNDVGYISCKQTGANNAEITEAFKGTTCDTYNSGKKL